MKARGKLKENVFDNLVKVDGIDEEAIRAAEKNIQIEQVPDYDGVFRLFYVIELPVKGKNRWVAFRPESFEWVETERHDGQEGKEYCIPRPQGVEKPTLKSADLPERIINCGSRLIALAKSDLNDAGTIVHLRFIRENLSALILAIEDDRRSKAHSDVIHSSRAFKQQVEQRGRDE